MRGRGRRQNRDAPGITPTIPRAHAVTFPQDTVLRLRVPARPAGVVAVRQALAGACNVLAPHRADDVRVAVSEACDGAVRFAHLNPLAEEELDVELRASREGLTLIVRGAGAGMSTTTTPRRLRASLMGAVADRLTVVPHSAGTETRLHFDLDGAP